jgi:hypothetical protein
MGGGATGLLVTGWSEPVPGRAYSRCGLPPFHGASGQATLSVTSVNGEQAPKTVMQDPIRFRGRPKLVESYERTNSIKPGGVLATA